MIAISGAKMAAEDQTAVYWSYRGGSMPKVSKALSDVFFGAYVGNGNVRYLAFSEPVGVVTADDKQEYLSVRTDRKAAPDRPAETGAPRIREGPGRRLHRRGPPRDGCCRGAGSRSRS